MKSDRLSFPLRLSAGVVVALGLICLRSSGHDVAVAAGAAPRPAVQSAPAAAPQNLAQAQPPAPPTAPPPIPGPAAPSLTPPQLDQLLAPVALYPDQLLGQILMASTYPLEIVEAARWVGVPAHRRLKGRALIAVLRDKGWDPSVMALVPFPRLLELMNTQIAWTQKLGAAFIAQQADVMNEVQRLRQQAIAAGNFKSGPHCGCIVAHRAGYVTVAPANPAVVYVPVYDAAVIYGPWLYPAYPPFLFPYPLGFAFAPGYYIGFDWGIDVAVYGPLWGWGSIDWGGGSIIVDPARYAAVSGQRAAFAGSVWAHNSTGGSGLAADRAASVARVGGTAAGARAAGVRGAAGGAAARTVTSGHAARAGGRGAYRGAGRYGAAASRGGFHGGHAAMRGGFHGGHAAMGGGFHGGHAAMGGGFHGGHVAMRGGFHGGHAAMGGGFHGAGFHGAGGGHAMMGGGGGMHFAPGAGGGGHGGGPKH